MKHKISDFQLMKSIKENNDEWSLSMLWKRYQPMVHKRTNYLYSIVRSRFDYEDIYQEFFLSFIKAIEYLDISKIPDSSFHFSTIYFFFLRKKEYKIKKEYFRLQEKEIEIASYSSIFEGVSDQPTDDSSYKHLIPNFLVEEGRDVIYGNSAQDKLKNLYENLNSRQQMILDLLLSSSSISDISKALNEKYHVIYKEVKKIREKTKSFFEVG